MSYGAEDAVGSEIQKKWIERGQNVWFFSVEHFGARNQ